MFCASCGRQNESGVKFCTTCGESLQGAGEPAAPPPVFGGGDSATTPANPWPGPPPASPSGGFSPAPLPTPISRTEGQGLPIKPMVIGVVVLAILGFMMSRGRSGAPPKPVPTPTVATSPVTAATPLPVATETPPASTSTSTSTAVPVMLPPVALPTRVGATTAVQFSEPEMCRAVDNDGRAINPTNRFEPTWPFFCSVRAVGLKKGSSLVAFWQSPTGKTNKKEIVSDRVGDYHIYFTLSPRTGTPWDLGAYRLSLIADGVLQQTIAFEVVPKGTDAALPGDGASHVQEAVACAAVDERHHPVNPTATFSPNTSAVFVATRVRDVTRGKSVLTRWYLNDAKIKEISLAVPRDGSGWLSFKLTNNKAWPVGQYKVEVLYDGVLGRTVAFAVR